MAGPYLAFATPLGRQDLAAGTDLSAYPTSTIRYLRERGLVRDTTGTTFTAAVAFGSYAQGAAVSPGDFSTPVFMRLLAKGYVVGSSAGAPTVFGVASSTQDQPTTNPSLVLPVGIQSTDYLLILFSANENTTPTLPGSPAWSTLAASASAVGTYPIKLRGYHRQAQVADAGATLTLTAGNAYFEFVVVVLRPPSGLAVSLDTFVTNAKGADGTSHSTPTVTTTGANRLLIHAAMTEAIDGNPTVPSWGAGVNTVLNEAQRAADFFAAAVGSETQGAAGTSTARTATGSSGSWVGGCFAFSAA